MKLFAPGSKLSEILTLVFDLVLLNFLFILTCLPVITIGAAFTSLYKVAMQMASKSGGGIIKEYFTEFKVSFIKSTGVFLGALGLIALLLTDLLIWRNFITDVTYTVVSSITFILMALVVMIAFWSFALISRFENSLKHTVINGAIFALRYLVPTLIMCAAAVGWIFLLLYFSYLWGIVLLFGFSISAYLRAYYVNSKFRPFMEGSQQEISEA